MSNQPRVAKVLAALLASMTVGAIVLMALGNNPPSAGAFSLWKTYCNQDYVKEAIPSRAVQARDRWNCIEVFYSNSKTGNIRQLASLSGLARPEDVNCHFVVCNGLGGNDGEIQPTERWQRQWSSIPRATWHGAGRTVRICVIADGKTARPTDCQIRMTRALVAQLCATFNIHHESVYYPSNWW